MTKRRVFCDCHPAVILIYYTPAVGLTLCTMQPLFLVLLFMLGFWNATMLCGARKAVKNAGLYLAVTLIVACCNAVFGATGLTLWFYVFDHPVTQEGFFYGVCSGLMLTGVLQWFSGYRQAMTNDKFLRLFGRVLPSTALLLSMVFRALPETIGRGAQIEAAQSALLGGQKQTRRVRFRSGVRLASILMSWSMESSIETADSMHGRGYGERKRSSFVHERLSGRDLAFTLILSVFAVGIAIVLLLPAGSYSFFPFLSPVIPTEWTLWAAMAAVLLLLLFPQILEGREALLWKRSRS